MLSSHTRCAKDKRIKDNTEWTKHGILQLSIRRKHQDAQHDYKEPSQSVLWTRTIEISRRWEQGYGFSKLSCLLNKPHWNVTIGNYEQNDLSKGLVS